MSKQLDETVLCRQNAPEVFDHVASIYVLDSAYVKRANHLLDGHAEGFDIGVEKSFDIDSPFDAEIVAFLLKRKQSQ